VRLRVLRVNERARTLYESLGFRVIEEQPERFIMEVAPNAV
jgi:ribosomal protein S18 acetylase RimI-like enzyme